MDAQEQPSADRRRPAWLRRLAWAALALLALLALATAAAAWRWRAPLPVTSGRLAVTGLEAAVEVRRDQLGVPRVRAASERDAAFATGFLHGQDRMFQMDLLRRVSAGRLSELFGPPALPADRRARRLSPQSVVDTDLASLSGESRALLEAYAAGVNAAATAAGRPLEYALLRAEFEPWSAADCLRVSRTMQERLVLSSRELDRFAAAERVGAAAAAWLLDGRLAGDPVAVEAAASAQDVEALDRAGLEKTRAMLAREAAELELSWSPPVLPGAAAWPSDLPPEPPGDVALGSNAWAVAGRWTAGGAPLLANDTHLALDTPSPFYMADLRWPGVHVAGATVPGFPGVVIGRNEHLAWGVTILTADLVDYVAERLHPSDPARYLQEGAPEGSRPFEVGEERIRVRGAADVLETVRTTEHGPVIDDDWRPGMVLVRARLPPRPFGELDAVRGFAGAADLETFRAAAGLQGLPGENLVVAAADGRIGYMAAAAVPRRVAGSGLLPVAGWRRQKVYDGWLQPGEGTFSLDPASQMVVSANHRVQRGAAGEAWNGAWIRADRAARAGSLLAAGAPHDADTFRSMQADSWSRQADMVLAALRGAAAAGIWSPPDEADAAAAWKILADWDARYQSGAAPGLFMLFWKGLLQAAFADDLGESLAAGADSGLMKLLGAGRFVDAASDDTAVDFWDDGRTAALETMSDALASALADAWRQMQQRVPGGPASWDWNRMHRARFVHPLGRQGWLAPLFNGPDLGVAGSSGCLLATAARTRDFEVYAIPAMRMVADLAPGGGLRMVIPIGQSGIPASPHYDDQAGLWSRFADSEIFLDAVPASEPLLLEPER